MNLETGKTYLRRGGGAVLITKTEPPHEGRHTVEGKRSSGHWARYYVDEGRWVGGDMFDHPEDLIEQITVAAAVEAEDSYSPLAGVLKDALAHAATGKGHDRHGGDDTPFMRQPSMEIARAVGTGYPVGQAMKKAAEAHRMVARGQKDAAVSELLGVINYAAIAILTIRGVR